MANKNGNGNVVAGMDMDALMQAVTIALQNTGFSQGQPPVFVPEPEPVQEPEPAADNRIGIQIDENGKPKLGKLVHALENGEEVVRWYRKQVKKDNPWGYKAMRVFLQFDHGMKLEWDEENTRFNVTTKNGMLYHGYFEWGETGRREFVRQ